MDDLWQNSLCLEGLWLHKYRIIENKDSGVVEICERCGGRQLFSSNVPNTEYLSHHIRSVLPREEVRFNKEYQSI